MTLQQPCREITASDYEVLTGLRTRMSEDYKRRVFFPAMFRFAQTYKEKGISMQAIFNDLACLTGYKLRYLKFIYYQLLKEEGDSLSQVDETVNPIN